MVNYTEVTESTHLVSVDDHTHSTYLELTFSAGGAYFDNEGKEGESHLLEHCLVTRSKERSTRQLNRYFGSRGINRNARTNTYVMSLEMNGHKDFNELMCTTMLQMAYEPFFDTKAFKQEHKIVLREVNQGYAMPTYRASRSILQQIYQENSPALCEVLGTPEKVSQLTVEDMRRRYLNLMRDSHIILLAVGGEINEEFLGYKLTELSEKVVGGFLPIDVVPRNYYKNGQIKSVVNPMARDGCQLLFHIPMPVNRNNRVERWVLGDIVHDKIMQRLRNELGLVYGIEGNYHVGDQNYVLNMACSVQHVERIVHELFKTVHDTSEKITPRNVNHLKKKYIRQQEINSDNTTNTAKTMVSNLLEFGIPDSFNDYLIQLQFLTAETVMELYTKMITASQDVKIVGISNNPELDFVMQRVEALCK